VTLTSIAEDSGARLITQAELLANAVDIDGPSLTATSLTISAGNGNLVDNGDGTWSYTPAVNDDTAVTFNYTVTDGTVSVAGNATLDITPANNAPIITSDGAAASTSLSRGENALPVTVVIAVDSDIPSQSLNYAIVGGADAALFAIDATTGILRFVSAPDFEAPNDANADRVYELLVEVTDGAGGRDTQAIAVVLTNVNEAPVSLAPGAASIEENSAGGSFVAQVTVDDPDAGDSATFSLVSDAAGRFAIDSTSGRITVARGAVLDYETQARFDLIVRVTDGAGLTLEQVVHVDLLDQAEAAIPIEPAPSPPPPPPPPPDPQPATPPAAPPSSAPPAAAPAPASRASAPSDEEVISVAMLPSDAEPPINVSQRQDPSLSGTSSPVHLRQSEAASTVATVAFDFTRLEPQPAIPLTSIEGLGIRFSTAEPALRALTSGHRQVDIEADPSHTAKADDDGQLSQTLIATAQDPVRVASVSFTAGLIWWLTRSGGLLTSMLMGVPAWRHVDLLPVLSQRKDDDEEEDEVDPDDDDRHGRPLTGFDDSRIADLFEPEAPDRHARKFMS
jgi:hypothetical protein